MTRAVAHYDPQYGPSFHVGGNITEGRPRVSSTPLAAYQSPTGMVMRALRGQREPVMRTHGLTRGLPHMSMADFYTPVSASGASAYTTAPMQSVYSDYGPQRMTGPVVRRHPRTATRL